jgi:predicted acyltransferase (DUF342 family)
MKEEDKKDKAADKQDTGGVEPTASQKSDKSPEELMSQVANADESLESGPKTSSIDAAADESNADAPAIPQRPQPKGIKKILSKINIYFLLFLFVVVLAGASFVVFYFMNQREENLRIETTKLTEEALEELKTSDAVVGDPRQILTIESNAVITGKVVIKDTLDVAGALRIGGPLTLPSINAVGSASFGSVQSNNIQAAGNLGVGGVLDVVGATTLGNNLTVAGNINGGGRLDIGGQATIGGNLVVNGTLSAVGINFNEISINRINISGNTPSVSVSGAAGGGATASVNGTDTAATVTINTGGGTGTGVLATIFFTSAYNTSNPHPVLTPNGPGCAAIAYYVTNISATQFAIASATPPPPGVPCRFNYIVIN